MAVCAAGIKEHEASISPNNKAKFSVFILTFGRRLRILSANANGHVASSHWRSGCGESATPSAATEEETEETHADPLMDDLVCLEQQRRWNRQGRAPSWS